MNMRTRPIVVIKVRRKIVMVVMVHCQLMNRGHMEIVMRRRACTRNGRKEYLRTEKPKNQ